MPNYQTSPFLKVPPKLLVAGRPEYFLGGFDDKSAPTKFSITSAAIVSDVATYTGTVIEGNIPAVGSLLTVVGSSASEFNVTNVAITAVSIDLDTGQGTISCALSHANATATGGMGLVPVPETSETTAASTASIPVALSHSTPNGPRERTLTVIATAPTAPTTWTANLQVALFDKDSDYVNVSASGADLTLSGVNGPVLKQFTLQEGLFYRLYQDSGNTTDGSVIVKILG